MEFVTLSNGIQMPKLGYGVYQVSKEECERCVSDALKVGYRHIDTAQSYFNEEEVGYAIANSGIPREELFITTKVWIEQNVDTGFVLQRLHQLIPERHHIGVHQRRVNQYALILPVGKDHFFICSIHSVISPCAALLR